MHLAEALPVTEGEALSQERGRPHEIEYELGQQAAKLVSPTRRDSRSKHDSPDRALIRTPSPKQATLQVQYESTPGNISQLGFDVALSPRPASKRPGKYGESLYTQAFETALNTVLEHESFLFSDSEKAIFGKYRSLSYEARFLYVRLFLRKKAAWFRIDKIGYEGDISDVLGTCRQLWNSSLGFADDESALEDLESSLVLLSLDELKTLAKEFNCKGTTKERLVESILKLSKLQLGLQRSGSLGLHFDAEGKPERKSGIILAKVNRQLGHLIRLKDEPVALFNRLHIVFYRSSEYNEKSLTTLILARISKRNFPVYQVDRKSTIFGKRQTLLDYEQALKLKFEVDNIMELNTNQTQAGLDRVLEIFELVFEPWQALVLHEQDNDMIAEDASSTKISVTENSSSLRNKYYARRFTAGWVWTRLIFKAAVVFAKRHNYSQEHQIWSTLLSQKIFRVGRRGEWYDRKALIEQHYAPTMGGVTATEAQKRKSKRIALATCVTGLQDPDTHQIYHNALQRRIIRLETDLNFAKRERHDFSHIVLRKPGTRTINGVRLDDRLTGKHSIWVGKDPDSEVGVEQLCLETYETEGWRGFHSENSIVTTLFAMLFWDILFMPVPGVFQTAFQTAPLDLATDAFFPARASQLNHRLALIENGGGRELIMTCDLENRKAETWCVGLNWTYELQDLLEIVDCLGGTALARLCKLFAEEYGHRVGGIGDLCLWNPNTSECMFVEVKGPGDRLSETQIAWLDQMSLAGIRVELCHVKEHIHVVEQGERTGKENVKRQKVKVERKIKFERTDSVKSNSSLTDSRLAKAEPDNGPEAKLKILTMKRENSM